MAFKRSETGQESAASWMAMMGGKRMLANGSDSALSQPEHRPFTMEWPSCNLRIANKPH